MALVSDDAGADAGRDSRLPPSDLAAEAAVLGCCLLSRTALVQIVSMLLPEDFYRVAHQDLFAAIKAVHASGAGVDVVTVASQLAADGMLDAVGGLDYLTQLQADTPATSNAERYARMVLDARKLRLLIWTGGKLAGLGYDAKDPTVAWEQASELVQSQRRGTQRGTAVDTPLLGDFITEQWEQPRWVIPGIVQRGHRVILVGGPKAGKSTLIRQLCTYSAFGYHPLKGDTKNYPLVPLLTDDGQPRQVTWFVCDLENDARTWGQECRAMAQYLSHRTGIPTNAFPVSLLATGGAPYDPINSAADRSDFFARIYATRPDAIVFGPLYKNEQKSDKWQVEAGKAQALLDEVRGLPWQPAIILEAHTTDNRGQRGAKDWGMWAEVNKLMVKPRNDDLARDLTDIYDPRGAAYAWWPRVLARHTPWMPFRAEWPARIDPMDGGPLQYDREPGWEHKHLMTLDAAPVNEPQDPAPPPDDIPPGYDPDGMF